MIHAAKITAQAVDRASEMVVSKVAEDIYETIRVEHPTPAGSKPKVIAADEFTPIFV